MTIRNTIFNDSELINYANEGNPYTHIDSEGYNLSSDDGGGNLTASTDRINTDPKLDPDGPQNNGGLTATIALLHNSQALDSGHSFGVALDQRGQVRPRDLVLIPNGPGSDVGALESADPKQAGPPRKRSGRSKARIGRFPDQSFMSMLVNL